MSTKATTYESLDNKIAASTLTEDLVKGLEVVDGHAIKEKKDYEKPDELYDMLIARIRQYHPSTDISMIERLTISQESTWKSMPEVRRAIHCTPTLGGHYSGKSGDG